MKLLGTIAFQNLMMTLVSATDALVLARVDQYSVAAVSLATEVTFVMNLFLSSVIGGIAILAAQYHGKGDRKTVKNLMGMALRYNMLISLVFFTGARFAPEFLMGIRVPPVSEIPVAEKHHPGTSECIRADWRQRKETAASHEKSASSSDGALPSLHGGMT